MYFRDLDIHASDYAKMPKGHTARDFNFSAHAVQEIFLTFMPRKYLLDGMGKTNLTLGPRNREKPYVQLINVNIYYVEEFDFRHSFCRSAVPAGARSQLERVVSDCPGGQYSWPLAAGNRVGNTLAEALARRIADVVATLAGSLSFSNVPWPDNLCAGSGDRAVPER
jgi:hypothetical protein